ncbi:MAG: hypothetical protein AAF492_31385, partial [Verrucomicrobiota bacterium]
MSSERLDDLVSALLNETASEKEMQELEQTLLGDAEARRRYRRFINLHAALRKYGDVSPIPFAPEKTHRFQLALAAGLLALLGAGILLALYMFKQPGGPAEARLATVETSVAAPFTAGQELGAGPVEVPDGYVKLKMDRNAELILEGPARIALLDDNRIEL